MSGHIFISYGSENRDQAYELCAFIESRGVKAWIAPRDVRPGLDYSEALQAAIEACAAFVVLVTEMANTSPYVRAETEMAFSNAKPIFPVRMSDIKPAAGLAFFLKIRHWTDAYGKAREANLDRLALELQALGGAPSAAEAGAPPAPAPGPAPAAPKPTPAAPAAGAATPADEELAAAAIGPNADWYLARWSEMDKKGTPIGWNWAACLLSLFWMAYRKMWLWLVLFLGANLALGALGSAGPLWGRITLFASIGLTFVTGSLGNHWYRGQVSRLLAQVSGLDREAALAQLRARGGVSKPAMWIAIGVAAALTLLVAAGALIQARRQLEQDQLREQHLRNQQRMIDEAAPAATMPAEDDAVAPAGDLQEQPAPEQPPPE